jgi:homoserine dehydrogenase
VGRALAELLLAKTETLRRDFDLNLKVMGVSTGRHGHVIDPMGIDLRTALDAARHGTTLDGLNHGRTIPDTERFLVECPADLMFESIPTNPHDGLPALAYDFGLLERGTHVVTANKGPVAFGYRDLSSLAARKGVGFFFESTVMDGAPVLGVGREGLPAADLRHVTGIFNSTTNYILTRMEAESLSFEDALHAAQEIGIAETDPTLDVDGWDAAIKTVILANVLMGADLRPADVDREGIRGVTLQDVQEAAAAGQRIRLVCEALRAADGSVAARVAPQRLPREDLLATITGTTSIVNFESDVLPRLTIIEHDPGPTTTAYGMLADMINIARGRHAT